MAKVWLLPCPCTGHYGRDDSFRNRLTDDEEEKNSFERAIQSSFKLSA